MKQLFPLITVLFLGYLGYFLALPIFPPLFLNPELHFFSNEMSPQMRRVLLGVLFAMYPIGQFFGAPILGKWSDKYGRKPLILISLIIVIPSYLMSGLSILYTIPSLLFFSRFLSGILEGNIVIAQAAISDISENSQVKTKNFGLVVSFTSSAFFFGPLIGGNLSDSTNVSWFQYETPFWCAAILSLIGFCVFFFFFKETHLPNPKIHISLKSLTKTFSDGLRYRRLRSIYTANLFIFLAVFFFLNFFSAYLVNAFQFSISLLGEINAYLSIPIILSPLFFGVFAKMWTTKKITQLGSILLSISYVIFVIPNNPAFLLVTLIPVGFFMSIAFAFPAILISNMVSKKLQGQALGINQATMVFAEAISALGGGVLMALANSFPIYLAAVCGFLGAILLSFYSTTPKQYTNHKKM